MPINAAIETTDKNAFVKISSAGLMRAASGTGGGGPDKDGAKPPRQNKTR
jgi:hypothetical protein